MVVYKHSFFGTGDWTQDLSHLSGKHLHHWAKPQGLIYFNVFISTLMLFPQLCFLNKHIHILSCSEHAQPRPLFRLPERASTCLGAPGCSLSHVCSLTPEAAGHWVTALGRATLQPGRLLGRRNTQAMTQGWALLTGPQTAFSSSL